MIIWVHTKNGLLGIENCHFQKRKYWNQTLEKRVEWWIYTHQNFKHYCLIYEKSLAGIETNVVNGTMNIFLNLWLHLSETLTVTLK